MFPEDFLIFLQIIEYEKSTIAFGRFLLQNTLVYFLNNIVNTLIINR